jgi:hypothetical protein
MSPVQLSWISMTKYYGQLQIKFLTETYPAFSPDVSLKTLR